MMFQCLTKKPIQIMDDVISRISLGDLLSYNLIVRASQEEPCAVAIFVLWNKRGKDIWDCYAKECNWDLDKLMDLIRSELRNS